MKPAFSWNALPRPIIALAPMSGYTDASFRQIVKEICPGVVCFSEFTNIEGLIRGKESSLRQVYFDMERERPAIVQLFGKKPESFFKASKFLRESGVDAIDINMGCPAKKVVNNDNGSALLKNPELAAEILKATVEGTSKGEGTPLPVSVKMRIGIAKYDPDLFFKFAQKMQDAGASLITVHGRTAKQAYTGKADWTPAYELKKILKIPVIGNGDIKTGEDAVARFGNLDGIMVGRAALNNPFIFAEIASAFAGTKFTPLTFQEKLPWIKKHLEFSINSKGEKWGVLEMRKHLVHYIRGFPRAAELRQQLMSAATGDEIVKILDQAEARST